jgi:protein-tyrosine-phosphatase
MARALFDRDAAPRHTSESAGSIADPDGRPHPEVVAVMGELGIDIAQARPRRLTDDLAERADVIVTMGCGDSCPYFPGKRYVDWDLPDPKGQPLEAVRETREEIGRRVAGLIAELDAGA